MNEEDKEKYWCMSEGYDANRGFFLKKTVVKELLKLDTQEDEIFVIMPLDIQDMLVNYGKLEDDIILFKNIIKKLLK